MVRWKVRSKMGVITSWPIGPFGGTHGGLFSISLAVEFVYPRKKRKKLSTINP